MTPQLYRFVYNVLRKHHYGCRIVEIKQNGISFEIKTRKDREEEVLRVIQWFEHQVLVGKGFVDPLPMPDVLK